MTHDQELILEFVNEARELIENVEPMLISLGQQAQTQIDPQQINAIFRLFHSLKGSAGFLNLQNITEITHTAETLLDAVRNHRITLQSNHISTLCQVLDYIRAALNFIEEHHTDEEVNLSEKNRLVSALKQIIQHSQETSSPSSGSSKQEKSETIEKTSVTYSIQITQDMKERFAQEALEQLEGIEQIVLGMLNYPEAERIEKLHEAFRLMHSVKGNAGFMELPHIEKLAHASESYLDLLRSGKLQWDNTHTDMMLSVIDSLKTAVQNVAKGGEGNIPGIEVMLEFLSEMSKLEQNVSTHSESNSTPASSIFTPSSQPTSGSSSPETPSPEASQKSPPHDKEKLQPKEFSLSNTQSISKNVNESTNALSPTSSPSEAKSSISSSVTSSSTPDIRVKIEKLDRLINLVGELVTAESMVIRNPDLQGLELQNFEKAAHHLHRLISDLQDVALSVRMIPVSTTFRKMIRLVHDVSQKTKKQVELILEGEETEIDKTVIEKITDPLVHLIRNSIDHGIELPEERIQKGKSPTGKIILKAEHQTGEVWISVHDDGRGLDREKILAKAKERNLLQGNGDHLNDAEVFEFIFMPGFSTATQVTDISGRGVGMDVVRRNIEELNGKVTISSKKGEGTTVILKIPLTLAIMEGLLLRVGTTYYLLPLLNIRETLRPKPEDIVQTPSGTKLVRIRDEFYPVLRLAETFHIPSDYQELWEGILVVIYSGERYLCLHVDEILGQYQTVIKGLSDYFDKVPGISGCSILGDGSICLILDTTSLIQSIRHTYKDVQHMKAMAMS